MPDGPTEVRIFRLYAEDSQGQCEATIEIGGYAKWPPTAAFSRWVRENHPKAGMYVACDDERLSILKLTYPDFVYQRTRVGRGGVKSEPTMVGDRSIQLEEI